MSLRRVAVGAFAAAVVLATPYAMAEDAAAPAAPAKPAAHHDNRHAGSRFKHHHRGPALPAKPMQEQKTQ